MALPCASVMVITVLLNVAATWATPDVLFLRSFLRGRAAAGGFAMFYGILFGVSMIAGLRRVTRRIAEVTASGDGDGEFGSSERTSERSGVNPSAANRDLDL